VNRARGEAISDGHRRNRRWAREHPGQRDDAWFKREIAPKLDGFSLSEIAKVTSLSLAACSRIRAGARERWRRFFEQPNSPRCMMTAQVMPPSGAAF
jgi:hypothetical protein